jgi:thiamine-phosphate pyrophosphorylase
MDLFSPLYPILDSGLLPERDRSAYLRKLATDLLDAGVTLLQYRNKSGSDREILDDAKILRASMPKGQCALILNDRADLCMLAGFDGVHVGQDDISARSARRIVGTEKIVGISTHNEKQLQAATIMPVDYIAIGPVFSTGSKTDADPVVGLEGVCLARASTKNRVVAIGGITLQNCREVREAGADSVAVISGVFQSPSGEQPAKVARDFLARFR